MEISVKSNKVFREVHQSKHRYIAMKGSAGSGKSVDTAQQYILRLMRDKGRNLLCMRKSDVSNRDSTYAELTGAIYKNGFSKYFTSTVSPMEIRCINGNKILFRGMNDTKQQDKVRSITFETGSLTDIWLEEATEFTQQDFEILDDRLRGVLPDGLFYQIKLTFNPVSATHWIKGNFFDVEDSDVLTNHSTYLDNRFCDDAYIRRMERRKRLDPDGYKIYGLGEWGETGGLVFTNYQIGEYDTSPNMYDAVSIGQDFGFNHANAILLLGWKDGDVYILDCIYEHEKDTAELIRLAEPKGWKQHLMYCDSAEPDRINMWKTAGYRALPAKKPPGSVKAHIDWLKARKIFINHHCIGPIKEIQQLKWQYDNKRGIWLDEPVKYMDDGIAALRYGTQPWRQDRGWGFGNY